MRPFADGTLFWKEVTSLAEFTPEDALLQHASGAMPILCIFLIMLIDQLSSSDRKRTTLIYNIILERLIKCVCDRSNPIN